MRCRLIVILGAGLLAGCSVEGLPPPASPPSTPSTSSLASLSPTPAPALTPGPPVVVEGESVAVDPSVLAASVTIEGVRVLIEAERNPMPAGEPTWVTTTLVNRGPGVLRWLTDSCETHVGVRAQMSGLRWAPGAPQEEAAHTFKSWASQTIVDLSGPISLPFVPGPRVESPESGCADIGIFHELPVGGRIVQRHRWDGFARSFGLPPSGAAELTAVFDYWWRDGEEEGSGPDVAATLPVLVENGRGPAELSPGQIVDVALAVPQFRAVLEAHPSLQEWDMPIRVEFDPGTGIWQVELRTLNGTSALVRIDAFGEVGSVQVAP